MNIVNFTKNKISLDINGKIFTGTDDVKKETINKKITFKKEVMQY